MTQLSTLQVARLIGVAETTVKRWADEGKIPCHRTLGGHRKFILKDIVRFAEDHAYPLAREVASPAPGRRAQNLEFAVREKDYARIARLFYDEALAADTKGILRLLSYMTGNRIPLAAIADLVIRPAMTRVGEEWAAGNIEINQEHRASNCVLEGLVLLNPDLHRKPANGLSAACACIEGDYHELGLRLLSYTLETEGWEVHYLGASTPGETLRRFVTRRRPDLICLSVTIAGDGRNPLSDIRSTGKTAREIPAAFLVGGSFAPGRSGTDFSCDLVADSITGAVGFLKDRFHLKPGPVKKH